MSEDVRLWAAYAIWASITNRAPMCFDCGGTTNGSRVNPCVCTWISAHSKPIGIVGGKR